MTTDSKQQQQLQIKRDMIVYKNNRVVPLALRYAARTNLHHMIIFSLDGNYVETIA